MGTPVTNFGLVTVSQGYNSSATSIALQAGHGSRLPSTFPYPLTWWNSTDYANPADDPNKEIVKVTNRTGDTLTVVRAHEGTSASNKNTAGKVYRMQLSMTKAMWEELQARALTQSFRDLIVRTHPDNDKWDSQVMFSAGAIVMDDGEEVHDWNNVVVDIEAAAGPGGLDTGSEGNSRWYSIHAIYNGTNKSGVLHREKEFTLDVSYTAGEDGQHILRSGATTNIKLGQGYTPVNAGVLPFIDLKLLRGGTPSGNVWVTLETNSGGVPSGTVLATSRVLDVSKFSATSPGIWVRFVFDTPPTLSAATLYHIVLQGDYTVSGSNYLAWRADTTAAGYVGNPKSAFDGTTWTADNDDDFMFKAYIITNDTPVLVPSGYKSAKIGYAYNDANGNFRRFFAKDRFVENELTAVPGSNSQNYIALTSGVVPLDLSAFIPPVRCRVWFGLDNSSASEMTYVPGEVPHLGAYVDPISRHLEIVLTSTGGTNDRPLWQAGPILIETPMVTAINSAGSIGHWLTRFEW